MALTTQVTDRKPVVMCFSGLDPTGGAGIQADIETLASLGCHCAPVVTVLTAQDTHDVKDLSAVSATFLIEQARAILEDMPVSAFKIGLVTSVTIVEAIHTILQDYKDCPVVLDPVLVSGAGKQLLDQALVDAIDNLLLPYVEIITPNIYEAQWLAANTESRDKQAHILMGKGCSYVLITGTHDTSSKVCNSLWGRGRDLGVIEWPRLEASYHGSGCTLAAAIAAYLGHGLDMVSAVREAQAFTWESVKHGKRLGMGQWLPNRLFWAVNGSEHTGSN